MTIGFYPCRMQHPLDLTKTEPNQALILVFVIFKRLVTPLAQVNCAAAQSSA